MPRFSTSSQMTASGICLASFLTSRRTQRSSRTEKVWKLTPLLPSRDRSALTVALKPSAVRGTNISFYPLMWPESPLWHEASTHDKKPHVSVTPETSMGGLFNPLPGGAALLVTARALKVVPSVIPHRGPDMSPRDLRIVATSYKAAGSEWSEPWAWD